MSNYRLWGPKYIEGYTRCWEIIWSVEIQKNWILVGTSRVKGRGWNVLLYLSRKSQWDPLSLWLDRISPPQIDRTTESVHISSDQGGRTHICDHIQLKLNLLLVYVIFLRWEFKPKTIKARKHIKKKNKIASSPEEPKMSTKICISQFLNKNSISNILKHSF